MIEPTKRFTNRVDNYVKYRPHYPAEVIDHLAAETGLGPASIVADVGAGTGILTRRLLDHVAHVYAVEPNDAMRAAAEAALGDQPRFTSVAATAEATTLPDAAVDFVTAGQAFHWFDSPRTRAEFRRILRPAGWVVLVWNERRDTPLLRAYRRLLDSLAADYRHVRHREVTGGDTLARFFAPHALHRAHFENAQVLDREGLIGRALSSSYTPVVGQPGHDDFMAGLNALFDDFARDDRITFAYDTRVYYGRLA